MKKQITAVSAVFIALVLCVAGCLDTSSLQSTATETAVPAPTQTAAPSPTPPPAATPETTPFMTNTPIPTPTTLSDTVLEEEMLDVQVLDTGTTLWDIIILLEDDAESLLWLYGMNLIGSEVPINTGNIILIKKE